VLLLVWFFIFDLSGKGNSTAASDIALRIFTHESLHPMNILGKMKALQSGETFWKIENNYV